MRRIAIVCGLLLALGAGQVLAQQGATSGPQAVQQNDAWRYKYHNGQWWYWLPSNRWVYWTGQNWAPHESRVVNKPSYSRGQRSYNSGSSGYYNSQGNWGPVRYNQYGQPQYPYSQRRSGLQQLGPVPAMGGVRSLPGWGGER
jgi:hypothetical protein